jgi:dihydrodipicolinate synthase/N-acetylneuraminate lyase
MIALAKHRPAIRSVFSGGGGRGMLYELRLGMDGAMPGAPYSDAYVAVWDAWHAGKRDKAREIFSALQLMLNVEQFIPATRLYVMHKRGVFKTTVSRRTSNELSPAAIEEIDFQFAAVKPYLRA